MTVTFHKDNVLQALIFLLMTVCPTVHGKEIGAGAHDRESTWNIDMYWLGSTRKALPFWSHTNKGGIMPETCGGVLSGGVDGSAGLDRGWKFSYGISLAGYSSLGGVPEAHNSDGDRWRGMIRSIYAGLTWKKMSLDLGIRPEETEFGNLSVTGGDLTWTGNAMSFPGYNLKSGWIDIPRTRQRLAFKFNFGDYGLWDNRFVKHTLLHSQSLYVRAALTRKLTLTAGMEAWAQWGGNSPLYGRQPRSFQDYLKILIGAGGGDDATESDRINALGNHLGRELIRLDWEEENWHVTFQHDRPFDDGSGIGFQNFPDAVNTLHFSFKDKDRWFSDFLVEFIYTKWQSGTRHERPATPEELKKHPDKPIHIIGGCDDYFNNGEYRSGWTYNGRTVGLPLFFPFPKDMNGITQGVINNRIVAWNAGAGGKIAKLVPYTVKITYSRNFGRYRAPFSTMCQQVSGAFEFSLPHRIIRKTTGLSFGLYADKGSLYPDAAGLTVRMTWGGCLRHDK